MSITPKNNSSDFLSEVGKLGIVASIAGGIFAVSTVVFSKITPQAAFLLGALICAIQRITKPFFESFLFENNTSSGPGKIGPTLNITVAVLGGYLIAKQFVGVFFITPGLLNLLAPLLNIACIFAAFYGISTLFSITNI